MVWPLLGFIPPFRLRSFLWLWSPTATTSALRCDLHTSPEQRGLGDAPLLPPVCPCTSLLSAARHVLSSLLRSPLNALCRSVDVIPDNPKFQQLQRELSQVLTQRQIHIQPDN